MAKFKVGDRVRCINDSYTNCVKSGQEYDVTGVDDPYIYVREDGEESGMYAYRFELIPSLTITTDKFYRTRSGKPTGRVTVGDTGFEAVVDGRVRIFDKAGGHVHGDADLDIVEAWVPRVGERVRYKNRELGEATVLEVDGENHIKVDTHGPYKICTEILSDLEPLPVAAPQPAAPPLTGSPVAPTPLAAQVDAIAEEYGPPPAEPDATLNIKFTSDFSELDAAILVRKKKLKKLIKLARKAGIELREAA